jgi:hypothetical protein
MNDNFIFHRYNHYNNNNIDISPRTHISVYSSKTKNGEENKQIKGKIKKLDSVDMGLNKLITLGRQTKKFIPSRESIMMKRDIISIPNYIKNKICNKLTPFQIYEKNKKLIAISLKKKTQKKLTLKSFNSDEFNESIKHVRNSNIFTTPVKHFNTINCNFKNKLIKTMLEKNRVRIQTLNDKIEFGYNKSNSMNPKFLKSYDYSSNFNKTKNDKFLNDFYIGKEKNIISLLCKDNQRRKKRKIINIHSSDKILTEYNCSKNKNKLSLISNYNDFCNNIYAKIPLVQLNSIHFSNNIFDDIIVNKIYSKYKKT